MILPEFPYYPRSPLDVTCMGYIDLQKGVSMFAPRRRGKTSFVKNELLPAAENRGYRTAYIDLWQREKAPDLAIVEALEAAAETGAKPRLKLSKVTTKAKAPFLEVSGEARVDARRAPRSDDLLGRLKAAVDAIPESEPWLLAFDEFQSLTAAQTPGFVAALRAALLSRPRVKFFATGSSRRELAKMFVSQKSPFLGMAIPVDLPDLDAGFIKDRCALIKERSGRRVAANRLLSVFERVVFVPEYLNAIVTVIIVEGIYDPYTAFDRWRERLGESEAGQIWLTLRPLDRAILERIATADEKRPALFAQETLAHMSRTLGGQAVTVNTARASLKRMVRAGLVEQAQDHGTYELAKDDMRLFLSEMA